MFLKVCRKTNGKHPQHILNIHEDMQTLKFDTPNFVSIAGISVFVDTLYSILAKI